MSAFELKEFVPQIVRIAEVNKCDASEAVEKFVTNLITMRSHFSGAEELNFHTLGQKWNALSYKVRNKQKAEVVPLVTKKVLPTTRSRRED